MAIVRERQYTRIEKTSEIDSVDDKNNDDDTDDISIQNDDQDDTDDISIQNDLIFDNIKKTVKLPLTVKPKGRPLGSKTTVVGLQRKLPKPSLKKNETPYLRPETRKSLVKIEVASLEPLRQTIARRRLDYVVAHHEGV